MPSVKELLAKIDAQANRQKNGGARVNRMLFLNDGEEYKVRFLHEIEEDGEQDGCRKISWYNRYKKEDMANNVNVFGPENYGAEDEHEVFYENMKELNVRPSDQYVFLLWNYAEECIQVLTSKLTSCSPMFNLLKRSNRYGTILDRDCILSKTGVASSTVYSTEWEDPTEMPTAAKEALKSFTMEDAIVVLKQVYKVPDKFCSEEEQERRAEAKVEREARQKEYEASRNGGPAKAKPTAKAKATEVKNGKPTKPEKEAAKGKRPWEKVGESEEENERVKNLIDLDSYDEDASE